MSNSKAIPLVKESIVVSSNQHVVNGNIAISNNGTDQITIGPSGSWSLGPGTTSTSNRLEVYDNETVRKSVMEIWIKIDPHDREDLLADLKNRYYGQLLSNPHSIEVQEKTLDEFEAYGSYSDPVTYKELLDAHTKDLAERQLEE